MNISQRTRSAAAGLKVPTKNGSKRTRSAGLKVPTKNGSKRTRSAGLKETDTFLKPEHHFIGFDIDDEQLTIIGDKKKSLKLEIIKETGKTMKVEEPSVIKNNHGNKKKQSKSSISSPEPNGAISNRSNKRLKKYNLRSNTIESLDFNAPSTLELVPTLNLTSSNTRKLLSSGGKRNFDISDTIYKLPFEHGWKRELVFRKSGESTILNGADRSGDVYYYSPSNQRLRSFREIQKQLDISADKDLTIENFTFLKQPIGMNDRSKELVRDAKSKLYEKDSFIGIAVRPKKSITHVQQPPFDYDLSDDENNKSSSEMKVVFESTQSSSRLRSKNGESNSESMNTSSSTTEHISEDCQVIKSSVVPKVSSLNLEDIDLNNRINKIRNSEMNCSLREIVSFFAPMQSFNYMAKALMDVFKHLKTHELLSASRVCTSWYMIAMNKVFWQNVCLENSMVYDWERFVDFIDQQGTEKLDTRGMLIPVRIEEFKNFWLRFSVAMKRAQKLKFIELRTCPTHVVEDIIYSLPQIEVLKATSIKNPHVTNRAKNDNDLMLLNLNNLGQMTNLTELRLKGLTGMKLTSLPSFENLINLNKLSLTSIDSFPKDICQSFDTITDKIEVLEIGDCNSLSKNFAVSLIRFVNLKSLRLENWCDLREKFVHDVFIAITSLEKLRVLELINIKFTEFIENELKKCYGLKALLIIPDYGKQSAATNSHLIDCLKKLSNTLTHLIWGFTFEFLHVIDLFITQYQKDQNVFDYNLELSHIQEKKNSIPLLRKCKPRQRPGDDPAPKIEKDYSDNVTILSIPKLMQLLEIMMPDAKIKVIKVPFSGTVRIYLSEQFNDL